MAKAPVDIRSLARSYTEMAIQTLAGIAQNGEQESARVRAAEALLDRGWGKAPQELKVAVSKVAKDLNDDELAAIAAGSSERASEATVNPSQLN